MKVSSSLRLAVRVLAFVALAGSGTYVIVYLWRWEWNRALITGVLFLATLVVVATWAILSSLRRVGERLDRLESQGRSSTHLANTLRRASAGHATRHFDWLRQPPDRLGVFVPILLGAGAVLSGLAYLIERLAGAVGGPAVDRTTARLLAYDVPLGDAGTGPLAAVSERAPGRGAPASVVGTAVGSAGGTVPTSRRDLARTAIAAVGLAVVIAGSVWVLREATQSRPDTPPTPARTEMELIVHQRSAERPPGELAAALWASCGTRLPASQRVDLRAVEQGSTPERVVLVLDRTIGEHARRRLVGCMEDTILERVQADVVRLGID